MPDATRSRISRTHRQCLGLLIGRLPANAAVLDAACGTGAYWRILLDAGCEILGVDDSTAALERAHELFPDVPSQRCTLQELPFDAAFDAVLCIDALETVARENWPRVLANLRRALRPSGSAYLTIALGTRSDLAAAHAAIEDAGLRIDEEVRGDGYDHVIARRRA